MVRFLDRKKRQDQILDLIIQVYIEDGKPISSEGLKERFGLSSSSATLRNIMSELEQLGYLSHVHTSSGRIPTQEGFRYYINFLMKQPQVSSQEHVSALIDKGMGYIKEVDDLLEEASRLISNLTHYAGFSFLSDERSRLFFWGTHFMLQEPEFEDISVLRSIFNTLEEEMSAFRDFLENNLTKEVKVFIGDEIGLGQIRGCSLVLSSLEAEKNRRAFLGILGPIRMNYSLAISRLKILKDYLEEEFLGHL
ncbi:MAG: hypothetical protein JW734_09590 [Candidatus Omnitrophica bacterium]|nr:hypothetical protein [Candidatus Omnitrophota bacterium]